MLDKLSSYYDAKNESFIMEQGIHNDAAHLRYLCQFLKDHIDLKEIVIINGFLFDEDGAEIIDAISSTKLERLVLRPPTKQEFNMGIGGLKNETNAAMVKLINRNSALKELVVWLGEFKDRFLDIPMAAAKLPRLTHLSLASRDLLPEAALSIQKIPYSSLFLQQIQLKLIDDENLTIVPFTKDSTSSRVPTLTLLAACATRFWAEKNKHTISEHDVPSEVYEIIAPQSCT